MTADSAAWKDEQPAKAWTVFPRRFSFSRDNASCPPNRRGGRGYALTVGVAMESAQPFGRYGRKNVQEARQVSVSRFVMVRAWRRHSGVSHSPFPDSQPGESQDTRLDNSHGCCRDSRVQRPVSAVIKLFRQGAVPIRHRTDLENKRDRNKAMTGKARIFRVSEVFSGQLPRK